MLNKIVSQPISGKVRELALLRKKESELIVWWYSGIIKNHQASSQPKVIVYFRELDVGGVLGKFSNIPVPLTDLGQLRLGSIWKNGICHAEAVMDTATFQVNFNQGAWKLISPWDAKTKNYTMPFPQSDYPLEYPNDKSWLIEFPFSDGKKLLIPCIEFFSRCYGRSEEVKRVLATYPWSEAKDRLYMPLDTPTPLGQWAIKLKKRMYNGDVTFLAHVHYEQYAQLAAKKLYAQIETAFQNNERISFIKATPWFQGAAQIRIKGHWIDSRDSFLGLQIVGCSDPDGVPILRDRENTNKTGLIEEGSEPAQSWAGVPNRTLKKHPEIVDLTDDKEPNHDSTSIEIEDPDFVVLGEPRIIIDVRRDSAKSTAGKRGEGDKSNAFSSGEPHGTGKGVGHASMHARPIMESQGMLRDVWNALIYLRKKYPNIIRSVEWFTFEDGFVASGEPRLVGLQAFDDTDKVESDIRNWLFLNTATHTARGILVARITTKDKQIYITELQRRPRIKMKNDGNKKPAEESFKGLVFKLNKQNDFDEWMKFLRSKIRHVKGIVDRLVSGCPGIAETFSHRAAQNEEVPCQAAAIHALSKVGVTLEL